jgi:prevent-host-death family protein
MDGVQFQGELIEITRHGRPAGYVLSPADFAALVAAAKGDA